jgi:hypothetical protein
MRSSSVIAAAVAAAGFALPLFAGAQAKSPRQAACEVQAAQQALKGAERQRFIDECLGRKAAAAPAQKKAAAPAQKKAAAAARENATQRCNRQADSQGLDGPKRAAYLSRCLRGG